MKYINLSELYKRVERVSVSITRKCRESAYRRKVAFMHIPKCAGTSVMECIRKNNLASWSGHIDGPKTRSDYKKIS